MKNQPKSLFLYNGKTQYSNLGDVLINKSLLNSLRRYGQVIIDDRQLPEWYCEKLDLQNKERFSQYHWDSFKGFTLKTALASKLNAKGQKVFLMLAPGDIEKKVKEESKKVSSNFAYFYSFWMKALGVRVCRLGISIGSLSSEKEKQERRAANSMYFYGVRDSLSEKYARQIGIDKVARFPDLAWLLDCSFLARQEDSENFKQPGYVIFSFRASTFSYESGEQSKQYQDQLLEKLDATVAEVCGKWNNKLVITHQVKKDREFCEILERRYRSQYDVELIKPEYDIEVFCHLYSKAAMVFSNRLHVLLLAMASGSLPVAVIDKEKHHKITGIFYDADLMELLVDVCNQSFDATILDSLQNDRGRITQHIASCFLKERKHAREMLNSITS